MNKVFPKPHLTSYEADYARWCEEQGQLLRAGRFSELDRENLAEEIESLARNERSEIGSRLGVLLLHLLKWQFQPAKRKGGWRATIRNERIRIAKRLKDSPSLKAYPSEILADEYAVARLNAADETGIDSKVFPETCPYSIEQVLNADFLPEN
jgi:hypothetical protein